MFDMLDVSHIKNISQPFVQGEAFYDFIWEYVPALTALNDPQCSHLNALKLKWEKFAIYFDELFGSTAS